MRVSAASLRVSLVKISSPVDNIWPGAYNFDSVDDEYRRKYLKAPLT
jgi:hypothetical protein